MTELQRLHDTDCTLLMGVLNITEDSFSDGGLWLDPGKARDHGDDMLHAGADIIDIGAESTRPGAKRVSEKDELDRVTGAAKALIAHGAVVSIDTTRSAVAQAALNEARRSSTTCPADDWTEICRTWWPTMTACTSCSIGVAGWPGRKAAPRRTPTPRTTNTTCSRTCMTS